MQHFEIWKKDVEKVSVDISDTIWALSLSEFHRRASSLSLSKDGAFGAQRWAFRALSAQQWAVDTRLCAGARLQTVALYTSSLKT